MKNWTLTKIAEQISRCMATFPQDRILYDAKYHEPSAFKGGMGLGGVVIVYNQITYSSIRLQKGQAIEYLKWLQAGNVGTYVDMKKSRLLRLRKRFIKL